MDKRKLESAIKALLDWNNAGKFDHNGHCARLTSQEKELCVNLKNIISVLQMEISDSKNIYKKHEEFWWGIKSPEGAIRPYEIFNTRKKCIEDFLINWRYTSWDKAQREGFRIVKVRFMELLT